MVDELNKKLSNLIRARFPYIYITTFEEDRVSDVIRQLAADTKQVKLAREIFTWTQTKGIYSETEKKNIAGTTCPGAALKFVEKCDKNAIFLFYDFHINFGVKNRQPDYDVIRKLRDMVSTLKTSSARKNIIFNYKGLIIFGVTHK